MEEVKSVMYSNGVLVVVKGNRKSSRKTNNPVISSSNYYYGPLRKVKEVNGKEVPLSEDDCNRLEAFLLSYNDFDLVINYNHCVDIFGNYIGVQDVRDSETVTNIIVPDPTELMENSQFNIKWDFITKQWKPIFIFDRETGKYINDVNYIITPENQNFTFTKPLDKFDYSRQFYDIVSKSWDFTIFPLKNSDDLKLAKTRALNILGDTHQKFKVMDYVTSLGFAVTVNGENLRALREKLNRFKGEYIINDKVNGGVETFNDSQLNIIVQELNTINNIALYAYAELTNLVKGATIDSIRDITHSMTPDRFMRTTFTVPELKAEKLRRIDFHFRLNEFKGTTMSSLGFLIDSGTKSKINIDNILKIVDKDPSKLPFSFRDANNEDRDLSKDQLLSIQTDIENFGLKVYAIKWELQKLVNNIADDEVLDTAKQKLSLIPDWK